MQTKAGGAIVILVVAFGVSGFSQEKDETVPLPARAEAVVRTLERQEKDGLIRLNQIYIDKLGALKTEYVRQSKLEEAKAVQSEIETMTGEIEALKAAGEPGKEEKREGRRIAGTKWAMEHPRLGGKATVEFLKDGTVNFSYRGAPANWSWEEIEPGIVETWGRAESKGRGWRFEFDGNSRKAVVIGNDRKSKSEAVLVR